MTSYPSLSLAEARATIRRGVEKTHELKQRTSFVVADRFGVVMSASCMDGAKTMSYRISRAKAHLTAVQQANTGDSFDFAMTIPILIDEMQTFTREPVFHGWGGQVIRKDGHVVGALSTGVGVPPFVQFPGVPKEKLIADGKAANGEDMVIAYALKQPYVGQHGDDEPKWLKVYGSPPEGKGTGLDEAQPTDAYPDLDAAIRLTDAAMAEAERRNLLISVAVVDRGGEVTQLDRMDGAPPVTPDAAICLAVTALNFGGKSENAGDFPDLQGLAKATNMRFLFAPGGLALYRDGKPYGAIGVSGADPKTCVEIAQRAIDAQ